MSENEKAALEATIAFCDAILALDGPVPGNVYNLLTFPGFALDHALKSQNSLLENHRAELQKALSELQQPAEA